MRMKKRALSTCATSSPPPKNDHFGEKFLGLSVLLPSAWLPSSRLCPGHSNGLYRDAVGYEAVTWLVDHLQLSREEALRFGQQCLEQGHFRKVLGEQDFADEYYFNRFRQDGNPEGRSLPKVSP